MRIKQKSNGYTKQPPHHHKALLAARGREKTEVFAEQYAHRSGIEGTVSQGVRVCDLRRTRYIGLAKTHLQHLLPAMAINITRVTHWLAGNQPAHLLLFACMQLLQRLRIRQQCRL